MRQTLLAMAVLVASGCVNFDQEQAAYCQRNAAKCSEPDASFLGAIQVSSRGRHTLARSTDNVVFAWGPNEEYQIGDGTTEARRLPTRIQALNNVTSVAAGGYHSLAVSGDGRVYSWGSVDASEPQKVPTEVAGLSFIFAIAAGVDFSLAVNQTGELFAWGNNLAGRNSGTPTRIVGVPSIPQNEGAVAAGNSHALALDREGNVWAWGDNSKGQLGRTGPGSSTPTKVGNLPPNIRFIAAGGSHSLAVDSGGNVWTWGDNEFRQLGYDTNGAAQSIPREVSSLDDPVTKVAAGDRHSLALTTGDEVMAWGDDELGQLGDGSPGKGSASPVRVDHLTRAGSITAGSFHSLAIDNNALYAWGANPQGLLGVDLIHGDVVYEPVFVVRP